MKLLNHDLCVDNVASVHYSSVVKHVLTITIRMSDQTMEQCMVNNKGTVYSSPLLVMVTVSLVLPLADPTASMACITLIQSAST